MVQLVFTPQLRRFVNCPDVQCDALSLRAALEHAFEHNPQLRGYVLDDQAHLRANVVIYIDGQVVRNRKDLSESLSPSAVVHVLQALSGG